MKQQVLKTIALAALLLAQVDGANAESYTTEEYDFLSWGTTTGVVLTNSETSTTSTSGETVYFPTQTYINKEANQLNNRFAFVTNESKFAVYTKSGSGGLQIKDKRKTVSIQGLGIGDVVAIETNSESLVVRSKNVSYINASGVLTAITTAGAGGSEATSERITSNMEYMITSGNSFDFYSTSGSTVNVQKITIKKLNTALVTSHNPDLDYQFKNWYAADSYTSSLNMESGVTASGWDYSNNKLKSVTVYPETNPYNTHDISRIAVSHDNRLSSVSSQGLQYACSYNNTQQKQRNLSILNVEANDLITTTLRVHSSTTTIKVTSEETIPEYALTTTMQTFSTKVSQDGSFDMQINTSNNIQYERIMIHKPQTMTIGLSKYATFCAPEAIDISHQTNFDAYYASSYNSGTGVLTMTKITDGIIPANTGVMLYGESGTFYYTTTDKAISGNLLHPVLSDAQQVAETYGDNTAYVLGNKSGIGFYRTTARTNMGGKAYLLLPTTTSAPRITFNFGDDNVTGINTVKGAELKDNGYFDLQGRKVAQPTKGLYIVNGKKVVVK